MNAIIIAIINNHLQLSLLYLFIGLKTGKQHTSAIKIVVPTCYANCAHQSSSHASYATPKLHLHYRFAGTTEIKSR